MLQHSSGRTGPDFQQFSHTTVFYLPYIGSATSQRQFLCVVEHHTCYRNEDYKRMIVQSQRSNSFTVFNFDFIFDSLVWFLPLRMLPFSVIVAMFITFTQKYSQFFIIRQLTSVVSHPIVYTSFPHLPFFVQQTILAYTHATLPHHRTPKPPKHTHTHTHTHTIHT